MSLPSPKHLPRPALLAMAALLPLAALADPAPKPAAPAATAAPKDGTVATVNGIRITAKDIEDARAEIGQQGQHLEDSQILEGLVRQQLLEQAARAENLQNDPDVKREVAHMESRVLIQSYLHQVVVKATSDAAVKAEFDKEQKSGTPEVEVKARHILLKTEDAAKDVIAQLDKGADFAKIADEKSEDKNESGGELGYFTKDKMVPEFADAAFKLKQGEYTKTPVQTKFGWHVILVEDRKPLGLDDVKDQISEKLAKEALSTQIAALKSKAKIEEFQPAGSPAPKDAAKPDASGLTLAPPQ